jgi:hypothetical protein
MESSKLIISGLNSLDQVELSKALGENVEFEEPEVPEGAAAEPATIAAIVTLGSLSIAALAVYLSKPRQRSVLKYTIRRVHPDGRIEEFIIDLVTSEEGAANPEIVAELSKWIAPTP